MQRNDCRENACKQRLPLVPSIKQYINALFGGVSPLAAEPPQPEEAVCFGLWGAGQEPFRESLLSGVGAPKKYTYTLIVVVRLKANNLTQLR